jgi:hypothetical protein
MTYSLSLNATAIACEYHARACRIALSVSVSALRGLNRSTLCAAACAPRLCATSARNRSRSFLDSDLTCACTKASNRISSGDGAGRSGTGTGSGTTQRRAQILNETLNGHGESARLCRVPAIALRAA